MSWATGEHGIDTVAFGWKAPGAASALHKLMVSQASLYRYAVLRVGGRMWQLRQPFAGIRFGVIPASGVVTAETRLTVALTGQPQDSNLIGPEHLTEGAARAEAELRKLGIVLDAPAHLRRVDPAAELLFPAAGSGLRFLGACEGGLQLRRLHQVVYRAAGQARTECIEWQTPKGRQTRMRLYDAGVHHKTNTPGRRLRLEIQKRWHGTAVLALERITRATIAELFRAFLQPWIDKRRVIKVETPNQATAHLYEQARRGNMTLRDAERISGKIATLTLGADLLPDYGRRLRIRHLRAAGIVLDASGGEHTYLDLAEPLAALRDVWDGDCDARRDEP
jgi:hypothetical protein